MGNVASMGFYQYIKGMCIPGTAVAVSCSSRSGSTKSKIKEGFARNSGVPQV